MTPLFTEPLINPSFLQAFKACQLVDASGYRVPGRKET
jgi:hypothetical protein